MNNQILISLLVLFVVSLLSFNETYVNNPYNYSYYSNCPLNSGLSNNFTRRDQQTKCHNCCRGFAECSKC